MSTREPGVISCTQSSPRRARGTSGISPDTALNFSPTASGALAFAPVRLEEAQRLWHPETLYLNTASYGLPPAPAWDALQAVLADWRVGRTSWERWGEATESARASFARLVGLPTAWVAIGANTS